MIKIRRADARGHFDFRWLQTFHTFSFGDYYDPSFMGFRSLRVINEDFVRGGRGFPTHGHRDMEIITYILAGALEHRDSMGTGSIIRPGDVQRMSAGTGVTHSEANASREEAVHLLQIWLLPAETGLEPSYEQKVFSEEQKRGRWCLIASPDGREGSVKVHQDASVYASVLSKDEEVAHALAPGRHAWLQVARGEITLSSELLNQGDGAAISSEEQLNVRGLQDSEVLLFDLA